MGKKKCTTSGGPPQLAPQTVSFDCGKPKPTTPIPSTAFFVSITYVNYPSDATKKCLVFQPNDQSVQQPALEISSNHLMASRPGKFSYNSYYTATACTVPIDIVLAKEGKTMDDLCGLRLCIGLHSSTQGDTCWATGPTRFPINDGNGNWAEEFSLDFSCSTSQTICCCGP